MRNHHRLTLTIAVPILLAIGAAGLFPHARSPHEVASPQPSDSSPARAGETAQRQRSYALRLETRTSVGAGSPPLLDMAVSGRLAMRWLSESAVVNDRFAALRIEGTFERLLGEAGDKARERTQALALELAGPYYAQYSKDGGYRGLRLPTPRSDFVVQLQKFVASAVQIQRNEGQASWEATEEDSTGKYTALYARCGDGCITKRKQRYLPGKDTRVGVEIERSEATLHFDEQGLTALESHESLRTSGLGGLSFTVESTLTLGQVREVEGDLPASNPELLAAASSASGNEFSRDQALAEGRPLDSVAASLLALVDRQKNGELNEQQAQEDGRNYLALKAHLRRDPRALELARAHVMAEGPLTDTYLAALRDAGTPEAQAILRDTMNAASLKAGTRFEATRDLSLVGAPTVETVEALEHARAVPALHQQSTYGLGSAAYRLREEDPGLATRAIRALIAQLEQSKDEYETMFVLKALGNAGSPLALDAIAHCLKASSEIVRAAAAEALRRIVTPEAELLLIRALADPSERVRFQAVAALGEHPATARIVTPVSAVAQTEPATRVRQQAVINLVHWFREGSDLRDLLSRIAENDSDESNRTNARTALHGSAG